MPASYKIDAQAMAFPEQSEIDAQAQPRRDERLSGGVGATTIGASGAGFGMSGVRPRIPWLAYVGVAVFIFIAMTVSALTVQHDTGGRLPPWRPFVTEYSAGLMILFALPAVAALTVRMPFDRRRWPAFVALHILASLIFTAGVVGGFVLLRKLIFTAAGQPYVFGPVGDLIYEYRKLALVYCGMAVVFYLTARARAAIDAQPGAGPVQVEATFDIRDGAKLIRARVREIVCIRSAGNYVEFQLTHGRRLLMRTTLASMEQALQPQGFVRTHRSWLVNPVHLRALEPEGSGDWRIVLEGGAEAPLSRRFRSALEIVRTSCR